MRPHAVRTAGYGSFMVEEETQAPRPEDDEQTERVEQSEPRDSEEPEGDLSYDEQVGRAESEGGMTGAEPGE
jgi:hypothetical protein